MKIIGSVDLKAIHMGARLLAIKIRENDIHFMTSMSHLAHTTQT